MALIIRDARAHDGSACADIYAPYVLSTPITFEYDAPDAAAFEKRIADSQIRHAFMVAELDGVVVGFAYGSPYMERAAYDWSCFVSVYLQMDLRRGGIGRALYEVLLPVLADRGMHVAVAAITQPNEASMAFHAAFDFVEVGVHQRIGWKFGQWWDVWFGQRELSPPGPPADLRG